jgi:hypothetical protein
VPGTLSSFKMQRCCTIGLRASSKAIYLSGSSSVICEALWSSLPADLRASAAGTVEHYLGISNGHAKTLRPRQPDVVDSGRLDVEDDATGIANEVVVVRANLGVVTHAPSGHPYFSQLSQCNQFVEGVVDGGKTYLGNNPLSHSVNLIGRQMDVLAHECLGDCAPLRCEPPTARSQPIKEGDRYDL